MRLEYGMGPEFEKRHAEVWPEVAISDELRTAIREGRVGSLMAGTCFYRKFN